MQGARTVTVAALAALGVALAVRPDALYANPSGSAEPSVSVAQGPAAAIAKARAAAEKAEHRARESDDEADTALDMDAAPKGRVQHDATAGSGADESAPQDPASDGSDEAAEGKSSYDVAAHRDPFEPPRLSGAVNARTPLENYQLGQLKLVGVVAQSAEGYRAMVEDSAGLGYIITTGTPIGSSGGVVRSIEPRRVVIEESTRDFYGDIKPKEVVMELPQEDRSP